MININVDEGYAYDFLAILNVKKNKALNNSEEAFKSCFEQIEAQVGSSLHFTILNSNEYKSLLGANEETFDAVEKARYGSISAKEVDNLNMKRYHCKILLQNKFFPKTKILETKT